MADINVNFSEDLKTVFDYINHILLKEFPSKLITTEYFMLAVLECEGCAANKAIMKIMISSMAKRMEEWYRVYLSDRKANYCDVAKAELNCELDSALHATLKAFPSLAIDSLCLLYIILRTDNKVRTSFRILGVTSDEIEMFLADGNKTAENCRLEGKKDYNGEIGNSKKNKTHNLLNIEPLNKFSNEDMDEVEKNLIDLNKAASEGKIREAIGNEDIIEKIFIILQKKYKNNVILVGEPGVGKTVTVEHIANMITQGNVPEPFKSKKLMRMDFSNLLINTMVRGSFEKKFKAIINSAKKNGNYIFFIDDIHLILSDKRNFGDIDILGMLNEILMNKKIQFICTASTKGYKRAIEDNTSLSRKLQLVTLEPSDKIKTIKILNCIKNDFEVYHNVEYCDDAVENCIKLCNRYISNGVMPDSAIDVLDEAGARASFLIKPDDDNNIKELKNKINDLYNKKEGLNNLPYKDYDIYDKLTKDEIALKAALKEKQKQNSLEKKPYLITVNDIKKIISKRSGVPIEEIRQNEKDTLRFLEKNIEKYVIGQDEAVDEVCKVIKKQRLGISDPSKPPVFLFTGATGTGKTYLARKIADEIFGDEKYLVRFDMSEYSDKMSVNKLYGAANGYIGYENGGQLTEAVKRKKHCVLLLDEIEKANEEVHNVFLQLFDEGRLTDNTGCTVDFKNVIIIMTSNIGAKEISDKGKSVGFIKDSAKTINKEIINKAIKKKFKPEFINRINKIIYFNTLSEKSLKQIIRLELQKLENRINDIGFSFSDNFICDELIDKLYDETGNFEYGAREINRKIESNVEDKIMNYMLSHDIEKNHVFNKEELKL